MFSCCGNSAPVVADDVAVPTEKEESKPAQETPVAQPVEKPPKAAPVPVKEEPKKAEPPPAAPAPKPVPKAAPKAAPAAQRPDVERFSTGLSRETLQTPWGVDLTSDSDHSLSIVRIAAEGAMAKSNQSNNKPLLPGDVMVNISGAKTKMAMVAKLKSETNLTAEVVRCGEFDAVLKKNVVGEALSMDVNDAKNNTQLLIQKIPPVASAVTRYNEQYYEKPIVEGDHITSVNGKSTVDEMVKEMQASSTLTLRVKRAWA